ncbi:MAG: PspC domain-containing protein [Chloroflexota bacterium]
MQQPVPRRLTKGRGRMVGGVASGFAEYFNLDVTLVRVGWVVSGLFAGPAALIGYLLFLVIMPAPDEVVGGELTHAQAARSAQLLGLVLLVLGVLMLLGAIMSSIWMFGSWFMPPGLLPHWFDPARFIWPLLIILGGVFLMTRKRS